MQDEGIIPFFAPLPFNILYTRSWFLPKPTSLTPLTAAQCYLGVHYATVSRRLKALERKR